MKTNITELAQRMKAAAEKLGGAQWQTRKVFSGIEVIVKGSLEKGTGCVSFQPVAADIADTKTARAIALFSPANVHTLVEALEKAQQVDEELCKLLPPGAEYMAPPDGGNVTPLEGVRRMVADYRQRIVELEKAQAKADVYDMLRDDYGLREKGVGLADFVDWQAKRIAELEGGRSHE